MTTDKRTMRLARSILAGTLLFCASPALAQSTATFNHGINITRLFDSPPPAPVNPAAPYPAWQNELSAAELVRLHQAGFDFVRLPIDPGFFLDADATSAKNGLTQIIVFLHTLEADGFSVIVDLHPRTNSPDWTPQLTLDSLTGPKFTKYAQFVTSLAGRLAAEHTNKLVLELMNEPQMCVAPSGPDWTVFQQQLIASARKVAPTLGLVVTGSCYSSIDGLAKLTMPQDPNLYVMVHFYEPFLFTHQGAPWSSISRYVAGVRYPMNTADQPGTQSASVAYVNKTASATAAVATTQMQTQLNNYFTTPFDAQAISKRFDQLAAWATSAGVPASHVIIGEFGVMIQGGGFGGQPADLAARAQWMHDVSSAATAHGFPWSVWGYHGQFGIVSDNTSRILDPAVIQALFGP
jgi:hypothetical protein